MRDCEKLLPKERRAAPSRSEPASGRERVTATIRAVIEQGTKAPDFELPDQDGNLVKLFSLRGKPTVVYLYPKADTLGTIATKPDASREATMLA